MISTTKTIVGGTLPKRLLQGLTANALTCTTGNRAVSSSAASIDVVHTFKSGELAGRTLQLQTNQNRGTMAYSIGFAKDFSPTPHGGGSMRAGLRNGPPSAKKQQLMAAACGTDQLLLDFAEEERFFSSTSSDFNNAAAVSDAAAATPPKAGVRRRDAAVDTLPMPRTYEEATEPTNRPMVVTEIARPYSIVHVNEAWEGLCGYTRTESLGQSLGTLLQGSETDRLAVTGIMAQLLRGEEAGAVLTNYRKDGDSFQNRLRVAPLWDGDKVTHFVGVLSEVHDEQCASP